MVLSNISDTRFGTITKFWTGAPPKLNYPPGKLAQLLRLGWSTQGYTMKSATSICPSQTIRQEGPEWGSIRIHEVQTIQSRPTLCRQWVEDGVRNENVGSLVRDALAESDTTVAGSFTKFVKSRTNPRSWFTFLCEGDTVMAMATCTAAAPNRQAMRSMRHRLSTALSPDTPKQDRTDDRLFVLINGNHSIKSVSSNAPAGPALTDVLKELSGIHKLLNPPTKWAAWVPGYLVEFQPMDHPTLRTLAILRPVGRAKVPRLAQLTPTQAQIVRFAANGSTAPEIARSLNRSIETVRTHLRAAYKGLQVCSRVELLPSAHELTQWGAV